MKYQLQPGCAAFAKARLASGNFGNFADEDFNRNLGNREKKCKKIHGISIYL